MNVWIPAPRRASARMTVLPKFPLRKSHSVLNDVLRGPGANFR